MILANALALAAAPAQTVVLPEGPALTEAIRARDAEFFELAFLGCDPERLRTMLTPDFEMYHDRDGVSARSADIFVADYARGCAGRRLPNSWRSRRALVPASLRVYPVPGYGAIEDGEHLFYEHRGDRPEYLTGRARFTQIWALTPTGWRLARVLSYAHEAVPH